MFSKKTETQEKIYSFLLTKTQLKQEILKDLAEKKVVQISKFADKNSKQVNLFDYIQDHYDELNSQADNILSDISKKIIPESFIVRYLKDIGFMFAAIIPAMIALAVFLLLELKKETLDTDLITLGVTGIIPLVIFMIGSLFFSAKK